MRRYPGSRVLEERSGRRYGRLDVTTDLEEQGAGGRKEERGCLRSDVETDYEETDQDERGEVGSVRKGVL